MENSLFGEDFNIDFSSKSNVKNLVKKVNNINDELENSDNAEKMLGSNKLTLAERLSIINANVLKILGKQKNNVIVIKDYDTFSKYIDSAIAAGRIAVDTETNNSLDPVTCKIMGLCLYVPGEKQAYIPINHRNPDNKEKLSWQLTEDDCRIQLQRVKDAKLEVIMHNGKFDYEVIKCTCGIALEPTWDTMICARLLNENELAGLKYQYVTKIDKTQSKYDIENLFENVAYADVDPDIFALYAATDSMMTDKLYLIQKAELDKPEYGPHMDIANRYEVKGLRWLFHEIEMPIVVVTAEMELTGVNVDGKFGDRLKEKYNKQLEDVDAKIAAVFKDIDPVIKKWRLTQAANEQVKTYVPKKSKMSAEKIAETYPLVDKNGKRYKLGKSKNEILEENVNLSSTPQLVVLFYDVLGLRNLVQFEDGECTIYDEEKLPDAAAWVFDRTDVKTGKDDLKVIKEKLNSYLPQLADFEEEIDEESFDEDIEEAIQASDDKRMVLLLGSAAKLADYILIRRGITKLLTTYIDVIPDLVKHWPDNRIRFHLNQLGTDTGRFSSGGKLCFMENEKSITVSGINIQNIPSHNPEIRMLFVGGEKDHKVEETDNFYSVPETDEVETSDGWKQVEDLKIGDIIIGEDNRDTITKIVKQDKSYLLYV